MTRLDPERALRAPSIGDGSSDVLIVGGGVVALSIAEGLAAEGASVRLVEADSLGGGASGAAAGMLAPIGEAGLVADLPVPDDTLGSAGEGPKAIEIEMTSLALGLESLGRFESLCRRLRETTGIDPEFEHSGRLEVAEIGVASDRLHRLRAALAEAGRAAHAPSFPAPQAAALTALEILDRKEIESMGIRPADRFRTGLFSAAEAHIRPPLFVRALAAAARARGARIDEGIRVHGLRRERGRVLGVESSAGSLSAGLTIIAAGVSTPPILGSGLAADLGLHIEPVRGQILLLEDPLPPMQSLCWAREIYFVPKRDGSWVVGATEENVGFDRRVTASGVRGLLERAMHVFPQLANASFGRAWAGLRPVSADGRAVVGGLPGLEGLMVAAGHGRNGVLLAPMTAQIVVDLFLGKGDSGSDSGSVYTRWLAPRSGSALPGANV